MFRPIGLRCDASREAEKRPQLEWTASCCRCIDVAEAEHRGSQLHGMDHHCATSGPGTGTARGGPAGTRQTDVVEWTRDGSRKKYLGGPGPSSFGRHLAAETWFRFFGGRGRRVSAENFSPSPQMAKFGGTAGRGGLLSLGSLELKMLSQCRTHCKSHT